MLLSAASGTTGSSPPPETLFWHPGPNPTADIVVVLGAAVLLIRRSENSPVEAGKWALPGGFVNTPSPRGAMWTAGSESPAAAAIRELEEETGLSITKLPSLESRLISLGVFEGGGRDPRDEALAWSRSHAFAVDLDPSDGVDASLVSGRDDASSAGWFCLDNLPPLAFDHLQIIREYLSSKSKR